MHIVCAIVFCLFTFVFLYCYQADILAVGQHVLSDGQTHYNRTVGAILITLTLYLLQLFVFGISGLKRRTHALTYFPSLLILAILTDISPNIDSSFSFGVWIWLFPLLIVLYACVVWLCRQFQPYEPNVNSLSGLFSRTMWINILTLCVMFFMVGLVSNSNSVFHYRMHVESCLLENDFDGAIHTGKGSLQTDSSLTMLRAYALANKGQLGDHLFEYPILGGSKALLPNGKSVKSMMYPAEKIKHFYADKKHKADFILMGLLLDRQIDRFVKNITLYYKIGPSLPKHYREALILYTHMRSNPLLVYKEEVMDADFQDLQDMQKKYPNRTVRESNVRDTYGNTYWYYFQYGK